MDSTVMQEMINNHENCRISEENNISVIRLRPKAIDESLKDKLSDEDISIASDIMARQRKINGIKGNLCYSCQNTECANKDKCMAALPTGKTNADVMIINKQPTKYEVGTMCCLSDAPGSFLSLILSKMGVSRDDVYCTDMIKCNTQLDEHSFNECMKSYLIQEVNIVSPKVIICNGLSVLKTCIKSNIFHLDSSVSYGNIYSADLQNGNKVQVIAMYDLDTVLKKTGEDYNKCKNELWGQILKAFKSIGG